MSIYLAVLLHRVAGRMLVEVPLVCCQIPSHNLPCLQGEIDSYHSAFLNSCSSNAVRIHRVKLQYAPLCIAAQRVL